MLYSGLEYPIFNIEFKCKRCQTTFVREVTKYDRTQNVTSWIENWIESVNLILCDYCKQMTVHEIISLNEKI